VPASLPPHDRRPIRAETRATLVAVIARGRRWLDEMIAGTVTSVEQIAARNKCSIRQVNMTISLAQSRSAVHHEGGAGQAAMPGPLVAPG
jgi:site-specific DNA recombinase